MIKEFYNTGKLLRFYLKKDRRSHLIWLISLVVSLVAIAIYYGSNFLTEADKAMLIETLRTPAMILLVGIAPQATPTTGMMFAVEMTLFTVVIVAIMNILLITNNTRNDEESGRLELVRALPTGRLAPLLASLLQGLIINAVLALLVGLSFVFVDLGPDTLKSGMIFGAILGASGFLFAMATAVFAQIFQSNRTVNIASFFFLGFNFILRGITDIRNPDLSWISPLAWSYKTEVFVSNHLFPIFLMIGFGLILAVKALLLNEFRDLDGSYIKQRQGRKEASKGLLSRFGLVIRLNKTTFISWLVGTMVMGFAFGAVFSDMERFFASNPALQAMFPDATGADFSGQFLGMIGTLFSLFIVIPPLTFVGRVLGEEKRQHMEHLVSRALTRQSILTTYLIFALISAVTFVFVAIFSLHGTSDGATVLSDVSASMLGFLPATLFMIGLALFFCGVAPKWYGLVWLLVGYAFFVVYFGNMLNFPNWAMSISPYHHIPLLPAEELRLMPMVALSGLGVLLAAVGYRFYTNRDITA